MTSHAVGGSTMSILVGGDQTRGRFAVLHVDKTAGSSPPPHTHDAEAGLACVPPEFVGAGAHPPAAWGRG